MDWQFTRLVSPVFDLFDILLATSDKQLRNQSYESVIQHYYESLSVSIKRLGSDPAALFKFEDLEKQLKKFGKYGFFIALISSVALIPDDSLPDLGEMCCTAPIMDSNENPNIKEYDEETETLLRSRIDDLFTDLIAWGYYKN